MLRFMFAYALFTSLMLGVVIGACNEARAHDPGELNPPLICGSDLQFRQIVGEGGDGLALAIFAAHLGAVPTYTLRPGDELRFMTLKLDDPTLPISEKYLAVPLVLRVRE